MKNRSFLSYKYTIAYHCVIIFYQFKTVDKTCPGIHKVMEYQLGQGLEFLQFSGLKMAYN